MNVYKRPGSPYYWAKWMHHGTMMYRNTKERTQRKAQARADELHSDFHREQKELGQAAARFGCGTELLVRCPECNSYFQTERGQRASDGRELCGEGCYEKWNKRLTPTPRLAPFLQDKFLPYADTRAAAKHGTGRYYRYGVTSLLESEMARLRLNEITSKHAVAYTAVRMAQKTQRGNKMSPSTINCVLRTLRTALNLAVEWGDLPAAPTIRLAPGERQRDRVISDDEFAAYIEVCKQPWRDIALLVRGEGMRPGEALALRWEHILFENDGGLILIVAGKTRSARRQLPMTQPVLLALKHRHDKSGKPEQGFVFAAKSRSGHFEGFGKLHAEAIRLLTAAHAASENVKELAGDAWARAVAGAVGLSLEYVARHADVIHEGMNPFPPYSLRHTALTRLAEAGCDAFTLARIAGHSSISTTQRYVHPQQEAIAGAFKKVAAPGLLLT